MDLKATRGSFGEYGRIKRGMILRGLSKDRAEKLIKGGAFAVATEADVKAAGEKKIIDGLAPAIAEREEKAPDLSKMKIDQLKAFAKDEGIDLGEATKRDDILEKIEAALTAPEA